MAISQVQRVVTSSTIPKSLRNRFQNVPFMKLFPDRTAYGKESDTHLYMPVENSTQVLAAVGRQWKMAQPVKFGNTQLAIPVYTITTRAEHKVEDEGQYSVLMPGQSLLETERSYMEASAYQRVHYGAWFGFSSTDNQGLYTMSAKSNLPADSGGNITIISYIPTELFAFIVQTAQSMMNVTFNEAKPVILSSSVRIINYLNATIMPLTQSQKDGGGIDSIAGTYERVLGKWLNAGKIELIADELLKGTGTGGADIISFTAPGLDPQKDVDLFPQNIDLSNDMVANTLLTQVLPLITKPNPEQDFTIVHNGRMKVTPGALLRYEANKIIEAKYE